MTGTISSKKLVYRIMQHVDSISAGTRLGVFGVLAPSLQRDDWDCRQQRDGTILHCHRACGLGCTHP